MKMVFEPGKDFVGGRTSRGFQCEEPLADVGEVIVGFGEEVVEQGRVKGGREVWVQRGLLTEREGLVNGTRGQVFQQMRGFDGFDEVFISAELSGEGFVPRLLGATEHGDRKGCQGGVCPDPLQEFKAIHDRHFDVEESDSGEGGGASHGLLQEFNGFASVPGVVEADVDAALFEGPIKEECVVLGILNQED